MTSSEDKKLNKELEFFLKIIDIDLAEAWRGLRIKNKFIESFTFSKTTSFNDLLFNGKL